MVERARNLQQMFSGPRVESEWDKSNTFADSISDVYVGTKRYKKSLIPSVNFETGKVKAVTAPPSKLLTNA